MDGLKLRLVKIGDEKSIQLGFNNLSISNTNSIPICAFHTLKPFTPLNHKPTKINPHPYPHFHQFIPAVNIFLISHYCPIYFSCDLNSTTKVMVSVLQWQKGMNDRFSIIITLIRLSVKFHGNPTVMMNETSTQTYHDKYNNVFGPWLFCNKSVWWWLCCRIDGYTEWIVIRDILNNWLNIE